MICKIFILALAVIVPVQAQLILRKTETTRQVLGEKGMEATTVLEVSKPDQKALYTLKVEGVDGRTMDDQLFVVARGLEDVEWWSVYRLADGKPLFDTHVPVVRIGQQYAGLDVPADGDPRLRNQRLIGVVHFATAAGAVRRVEVQCADPKRAQLLRSYFDVRRTLTVDGESLVLSIRDASPDVAIRIPLNGGGPLRACDIVAR
jgi:hypothetical protein